MKRQEHSKSEFVKIFDRVCYWNSRWDRWNDMINLFAIEIANTVDKVHAPARNETYAAIAKKYKPKEFEVFSELFAELVMNLDKNPFQDFLGSMYMELELGNKNTGQFFTPYCVCKCMAEMTLPEALPQLQRRGYVTVNDPACGAGATLIAAAETFHERNINYQQKVAFVAQDIDRTVALMCYVQMSLIGCAGYVRIGDTISDPTTGHPLYGDGTENCWIMPMFCHEVWNMRRMADAMSRILGIDPDKPRPEPEAAPMIVIEKPKSRKVAAGQMMFDLEGG